MRRGVRFVGQELQAMSMWLPGTVSTVRMSQACPKPLDLLSRIANILIASPGVPVLLQQHQEQYERPMSRVSKTLRREGH